ncbi:MAG: class I SAM-dependent methyltransferase, partial [Pseudomonadota bacterium]
MYRYTSKPTGETSFDIVTSSYYRELWRFKPSGHFISLHDMFSNHLYDGQYASTVYGNIDCLQHTFDKIMGLPSEKSDNHYRTQKIASFMDDHSDHHRKNVLDIGSGTCVFLAKFRQYGWDGTALDPDPIQAQHARDLGFDVLEDDFIKITATRKKFNLITFNKVLEHVIDPIKMLRHAHHFLEQKGIVYIELPDCDQAWLDADYSEREEFFIEHHHGFSKKSLYILADRAGFEVID